MLTRRLIDSLLGYDIKSQTKKRPEQAGRFAQLKSQSID